jgi:hypothetical protein
VLLALAEELLLLFGSGMAEEEEIILSVAAPNGSTSLQGLTPDSAVNTIFIIK